jgi:hypothetical protein
MKPRTKLILAGAIALIVGFGVAMPLLLLNIGPLRWTPPEEVHVEVDIMYAYFGVQQFNQNLTGLWINSSNLQGDLPREDLHFVTYLFVVNITNLSDKFFVSMHELYFVAGPSIDAEPDSWGATDPMVYLEIRDLHESYIFNSQCEPGHSRLIALTGIVETYGVAYSQLQNGTIYLFTIIYGQPIGDAGNAIWSKSYCLKEVQLQIFGSEFLYNNLLSENQRLNFYPNGIDVYIWTIS